MEERGGKNLGRERSEREKEGARERFCVSEVLFPACPVALGWIYALDLEKCVCLCVVEARGSA